MATTRPYKDFLLERLKDPKAAVGYLNAVIEDTRDGSEESQKVLLLALRNIAEAQGGITQLAERTGLGRESLYKTLSSKGNPRLDTLTTLMSGLGFDLKAELSSKR